MRTLHRRNQVNRYRKLDERVEAHLTSPAPEGHDHWTLRLLAWNWDWWSPCPTRRCGCTRAQAVSGASPR